MSQMDLFTNDEYYNIRNYSELLFIRPTECIDEDMYRMVILYRKAVLYALHDIRTRAEDWQIDYELFTSEEEEYAKHRAAFAECCQVSEELLKVWAEQAYKQLATTPLRYVNECTNDLLGSTLKEAGRQTYKEVRAELDWSDPQLFVPGEYESQDEEQLEEPSLL